jgi:FkbM family methyltransferase
MALTLIVEPNPGGHRFQAVASVAAVAARTTEIALLTCMGARESAEFEVFLSTLDLAVEEPFADGFPATGDLAGRIADFCRSHDVATVVVMDGDIALKTWWLVAARAFRGLTTRPRIIFFLTRYPARLALTDLSHWRMRLAKVVLVLLAMATRTLDRASGFAGRDERARGWLVKRARDPAICRAHSRDRTRLRVELGLPADRLLVGIFGGINNRKNPQLVLDAMVRTELPADLVMAGPVNDDIRTWLAGLPADRRARVIVEDGFLPDELLDRYLAAADVVALLMKLEGPSGIQGKARAAGVPVITAGSKTRARELAATNSGAATDVTAESIAAGLTLVLGRKDDQAAKAAKPAKAAELDLPTAEAFAETVLGVRSEATAARRAPAVLGALAAKARIFWLRVRNKLARTGLARYLRPVRRTDLVRLGSDYGGWWVPKAAAVPGSVAYCAGAGEDITFDLALHDRGCSVTTFDPTPRAIAHVDANAPASDRFRFVPVGWWDSEDELKFYSPRYAGHVSHSVVNLHRTTDYFVAKVKPVYQLMAELGDEHVDIVKLDIEGAEYRTLGSLLAHGPLPSVLCVEFDQPAPVRRTIAAVRDLQRAGYTLNKIDAWNYTFTR